MIKNFLKDKTKCFYVEIAISVVSLIVAILYAATFGGTEYISWLSFSIILISFVLFFALSILNYIKIGVVAMMIGHFSALLIAIFKTYNYCVSFAINGGVSAALGDWKVVSFVLCVGILFICFVTENVMAWLKMKKNINSEGIKE